MSKQKSEFVSASGISFEIIKGLAEEVWALGGNDDSLRRIVKEQLLRVELAKLIVGQSQASVIGLSQVTVDRGKKLKAMIEAGRYDWTNSDITDEHFPVQGSGTVEIDIELVHYGRDMSKDAVLKDLDARGLRPIKIEELLALGAAKPELQREFPIIALGSVWRRLSGDRYCPCLDRDGSWRSLDLRWVGDDFSEICRFGAVRK